MENYLLILILCTSIILLFVGCTILKRNEGFSKWEKTNSTVCKKIRVEGKRIYKWFPSLKKVISIQDLYDRYLVHFPFVPRMKFDVYNNIIIEDYYDVPLTKKTKPKDYISQLWKIHHQIQNAGLYHNDYKPNHFFVDNNQIKLIDWSGTRPKKKQKKITNDMNHIIENLDCIPLRYMLGMWDSGDVPHIIKKSQKRNAKVQGSEDVQIHDKDDIERLVSYFTREYEPEFSEIYYKIERNVSRADIGRYLLIFYQGGIYLDNDVKLKKKITGLHRYRNGIWFTEHYAKRSALGSKEAPLPQRIANYVISCYYPKSPILLEILKESFRRTKSIIHQEWTDKDVLWSTGPDVVTTVISQNLSNDLKVVDLKTRKKMMDHTAEGTWRDHKDTVF